MRKVDKSESNNYQKLIDSQRVILFLTEANPSYDGSRRKIKVTPVSCVQFPVSSVHCPVSCASVSSPEPNVLWPLQTDGHKPLNLAKQRTTPRETDMSYSEEHKM